MNADLDRYHLPERTLVLSGISRSGTSLLSVLLNCVDNVVCFNEVLPPDPERLPEALARVRRDLLAGKPVRNKFARPDLTVAALCHYAGLPAPGPLPEIVRPDCNLDDRYPEIPRIRAAVGELCPARTLFGYD